VSVLGVFALALFVRLLVRDRDRVAFASVLVLIGVIVSVAGLSFDLDLTADLILMVFLPAIIFGGTTTLDVQRLWRNASLIAVLTIVGYFAHAVMRRPEDEMSILLLTVLVAYGSFLLAEHYLGMSGILAVVGAGLLMGAHEETNHKMSTSEYHVQELWTTASFLVTTVLYVLIGAEVRVSAFFQHAGLVVSAAVLVVVVRAATIYPLVSGTNSTLSRPVPLYCQHVMVWGGLHTVVPVALVLSLPKEFPFREELQVMVFGVAIISIVVQGLLMPDVLSRVGLGESSTE
jgi:CPA1 family monovalent cation:H+ antiporter